MSGASDMGMANQNHPIRKGWKTKNRKIEKGSFSFNTLWIYWKAFNGTDAGRRSSKQFTGNLRKQRYSKLILV